MSLTKDQRDALIDAQRGPRQKEQAAKLASGYELEPPTNGNWSGAAQKRLDSVLNRVIASGYHLVRVPGPRGGWFRANYCLVEALADPQSVADKILARSPDVHGLEQVVVLAAHSALTRPVSIDVEVMKKLLTSARPN